MNKHRLTDAEVGILYHYAAGRGRKGAAQILGLRPLQVKSSVTSILTKLQAHNMTQAVAIAVREGIID